MIQSYKDKCAFVIDNGNFLETAIKLSQWFGKVYYWSPWQEAYVRSNRVLIGSGFPNIIRSNVIWEVKKEVDLFVFPDVYYSDIQKELKDQGFRVWGSGYGEELELYRDDSKKYFKSLGLPVGEYTVIKGLDKLREYLKKHDNQFVKVSFTRGDFESFGAKNYRLIESNLDEIEHILGPKKKITEFIVEESIDSAIEIGYDSYNVHGVFPKEAMIGIEVKDKGYIGHVHEYSKMPKEITEFTDKISDTLKKCQYANFISTENRITKDHISYMNDFCGRQGSPPTEVEINMIGNLPDVMYFGAEGKCIDAEYDDPWGVEVIIDSADGDKNYQPIQFPEETRDNVKLRRATVIENEYYCLPNYDGDKTVAAAVATGKTMEEAITKVKKLCEQIDGYGLTIHDDTLDDAQKELEKLSTMGIEL